MKELLGQLPYYLLWSTALLALGIVFGVSVFLFAPALAEAIIAELSMFAQGILGRSTWEILLFIFVNNTVKGLGTVLFGVLFAVAPVVFLLVNGFVIGLVFMYAASSEGALVVAASILPHGVIELPAMIIVGAMGLLLGVHFVKRIRGETDVPITSSLLASARFFVVFLVPLFLIAALAEVFLTPAVVGMIQLL